MKVQSVQPRNVTGKNRLMTVIAGIAVAAGIAVIAATPAHAVGLYTVSSNWWEAYAGATSGGGEGFMQGDAYLGNNHAWGAYSQYNTKAQVVGFDFTHNAFLFVNGSVYAQAQS